MTKDQKKIKELQEEIKRLLSVDEMNRLIDDYIHWYNNQRIQKKLGSVLL